MDLNNELKEAVNKQLEDLLKKIGNNRQQLANKVIGFYKDINKELNKAAVDPTRKEAILKEVGAIERMAARQLPHLDKAFQKPAEPAPSTKPAAVKPVEPPVAPAADKVKKEPKEGKAAKASAKTKAAPAKAVVKKKK